MPRTVRLNHMTTLSFENLDFSFMIEVESETAYLQEWEDGNWSEPDVYQLPQLLHLLQKKSRLSRALKSFHGDTQYHSLCDALGGFEAHDPGLAAQFWNSVQNFSRGLAARIA
jgi:hypothetical protein